VTVFTLEPWPGREDIQARAIAAGVGDRIILRVVEGYYFREARRRWLA
jgi:hypothetical protein